MTFFRALLDTIRVFLLICFDPVKRCFTCCFRPSKKSIKGEVILVTGAGQGLGKEVAIRLSTMGVTLVLWDVNEECNNAVAEQIRRSGQVVHAYRVDVSNRLEVIEVSKRVKEEVGDVTILINNAGVFSGQALVDLPEHFVRRCFEVNVMAHFWILQQFLPRMLELDKGHVISVASVGGFIGTANMTDYCSSKFAAVGLMECLHEEMRLAKKNIKLTTVNPLFITTGLINNVKSRFQNLVPLLDVEETAKAVIEGILAEKEDVFIPARAEYFVCFYNCLSRKARHKLVFDYLKYGFDPVKISPKASPVMEV